MLLSVFLFSKFGDFVRSQLLMKPAIEKLDNALLITDEEFDISLKGVNVPDTNLKTLKVKRYFLTFGGAGARLAVQSGVLSKNSTINKTTK